MSQKSYFHYTYSLDNLKSIVENGFHVRASLEVNPFHRFLLFDFSTEYISKSYILPIISLCEIPFSKIKTHMNVYGEYGIGMNKKWMMRNGFNPVLYYVESSELIKELYQRLKDYILDDQRDYGHERKIRNAPFTLYNELMHFLKPYEANNYRKGNKKFTKYCFYNEQEWRFSPTQYRMLVMDERQFNSNTQMIQELNRRLLSERKTFNISDIDYLFVKNQNEVADLLNYFKGRINTGDLELLKLKLLTISKLIEN